MMGNKIIIVGLGMLLMAGFFTPLAAGENDSLNVTIVCVDRNYSVGDTVNIQFYVYENGALTDLADPSDMVLGVSGHHNMNNPTNITVTRQGTGVYQASYTVRQTDDHLYFSYEVTLGNDYETGDLYLQVFTIQDNVDISFCGQDAVPARSGEVLTATVLTRTGTTLIPVTGFTQLYVETPNGQTQNLTYVTRQDGIYDVEFTVPAVSVSGECVITAQPIGMWQSDSVSVFVNVLEVWYHKVTTTGNTVSFELCVADALGVPVEGANFYLLRNNNDIFTGVTNASGKALVHVPDVEGQVGMTGYVLASGLNQSVEGAVFNPVTETPDHNDFDILWTDTETLLEPGSEATIHYSAYDSQVPAASEAINYYITASGTDFAMFFGAGGHVEAAREILAAGVATTDSQGKFSMTFDVPDEQCVIDVRLEVPLDASDYPPNEAHDLDDGKYYEVWPQNVWNPEGFRFYAYDGNLDGDGEVSLGGGSFKPGKAGEVNIELSAGTGDPVVAMWGIGELTLEDSLSAAYDPEWMSWVPAGYLIGLANTESGDYEGTFLVPEFIEGQDVTIIAGYMDSADGTPHFDSMTVSPGSAIPWLWIIIIIVVIVVVIVAVVLVKSRM